MCESSVRLTAVAQKDKCHVRLTGRFEQGFSILWVIGRFIDAAEVELVKSWPPRDLTPEEKGKRRDAEDTEGTPTDRPSNLLRIRAAARLEPCKSDDRASTSKGY
jgi:hypothetical protein